MKNTAILVTTFLRDNLLFRCIKSIRQYYPSLPIYVGDNGHHTEEKRTFCREHKCKYIKLPFDCGVGGTRNEAIKKIPKSVKYLVIVEDDCIFSEGTRLETWGKLLDSDPTIGMAGGLLKISDTTDQHYEGMHRIEGDAKYVERVTNPRWRKLGKIKYYFCDLILNVFMLRLDLWRGGKEPCKEPIRWDPQFKTALEHADFFISLKYELVNGTPIPRKNRWKIAYVPSVWMYHKHESPNSEYAKYRSRPVGFKLFGEKWGVKYSYSDYNRKNPVIYEAHKVKEIDRLEHAKIFKVVAEMLNRLKIKWWLMSGTALGAIRENDFIEHDPDLDFGIAPEGLKSWGIILKEFKGAGFSIYKKWTYKNYKIELSFTKFGIKVDLFFHHKKGAFYWYGAFGPDKMGRWGEYMECVARVLPARFYKKLKPITFKGIKCHIPSPPEEFLERMYGANWQVPNKAWSYWKDCRAIDNSFFKKDKRVFVADAWDGILPEDLDLLNAASQIGTELVVGIYSDGALKDAGRTTQQPFKNREKFIKALRIIDRVVKINQFDPTRDFQKLSLAPDYLIVRDSEAGLGSEYVSIFGGKVIHENEFSQKNEIMTDKRKREDKIAVGIKTFLREGNFFRTVHAIRQNFPYPYKLYIADDGDISKDKANLYAELEALGHHIFRLPFNSGISVGRNSIVKAVREDYALIMDDDIEIIDPQAIKKMKQVLDSAADIGIVAGVLKHDVSGKHFGNNNYSKGVFLELRDGVLFRDPASGENKNTGDISYRFADQVVNFFLAKREVFDDIKWDNNIKVEWEHIDFFLRLKETGWKTAVCLDAVATHLKERPGEMDYQFFRRSAPIDYFHKKHDIARIINRWH